MSLPDIDLLARLPELSDEEKHHRTLAGLADVDAGQTITHAEMLASAQSLLADRVTRSDLASLGYGGTNAGWLIQVLYL